MQTLKRSKLFWKIRNNRNALIMPFSEILLGIALTQGVH
jgi:hypothetical protein